MAVTQPTPSERAASRSAESDKSINQIVSELFTLTVDYAKQEIRDPIVGLGKYLAYGFATMVLVATGTVLLALSVLRALQTETGSTFTGNWSWAPYALTLLAGAVVTGIVFKVVTREKKP